MPYLICKEAYQLDISNLIQLDPSSTQISEQNCDRVGVSNEMGLMLDYDGGKAIEGKDLVSDDETVLIYAVKCASNQGNKDRLDS